MAKRLNTRFVTAFAVICVGGLGMLAAVPIVRNRMSRSHAQQREQAFIESARELVRKVRYSEARDAITNAWMLDKTNKDLCVERGDILSLLTQEEGLAVMEQARAMWQAALEIDPKFKPAARRLLDSYVDQMEIAPSPQVCIHLRQSAERMLQIDADDVRAQAFLQIALVQETVQGTPDSASNLSHAISILENLQKKDPSAAEVLFYMVRGKSFLAREAYRNGRPEVATQLLGECRSVLDSASAKYPKNAALNFRAFQGYVMLADTGRDADQVAKDRASADAVLRRAREEVKEDDNRYADFQYVAADWAHRNNRNDEAEKILREFYQKNPDDQRARLALARLLGITGDPAKRDEAIDILNKQVVIQRGPGGASQLGIKELEAQTLLDLTSFRVSKYQSVDPANRPALLNAIDEGYAKIEQSARGDAIPVLRLKGLICELKGQNVEAVEALSRAMTVLEHSEPNNPIRYDLMYQLAGVDRLAGQNRAAEKLLSDIVEHFENYFPARFQLADLYLEENNLQEAARHIDVLAAQKPGAADVVRLQILLAHRSGRPEDAKKFYDQLAENKPEDKLLKAQAAATLRNYPETIRLLSDMQKAKPDDHSVTVALVQAYQRADQRDKSRQVLDDAIKRSPNDARLMLLKKEMDGSTPDEADRFMEEILATKGDPFFREIQYGRHALQERDFAKALEHARIADQTRPNDPATYDLYFQIYRTQQNWELASKAADNLGRLDADHAGGRIYHWDLAMDQGQYGEAISIARELTVVRNGFGQSWRLLAQSYQRNGQYHEALEQYQAALERQSTNLDAYLGMSDCFFALSQPDRAADILEQGRRLFPDSVVLREKLFTYYTSVDPVGVVVRRQKLLDEDPNEPENYIAMASACVHAAKQIFPKDPIKAKTFLDQAKDVLTQGVGKFPDHLRLNSALAEALQGANQYADGVKILLDLGVRPKWLGKPDPIVALAEYYMRQHQPILAEKALRDAWAKTKNKDVEIELKLASQLEEQGKFDEALELLKTNSEDLRVVRQTLQAHIAANHTAEATRGLKDALEKNPNNPDLLNLLAVVYIDGYNYPKARETVNRVLALDRDNEVALYYQALTEMRDPIAGDLEIARRNLGTLVTRDARNVQYKLEYVNVLTRLKDTEGVLANLEDAVRVDPFNRTARIKLLDALSDGKKWDEFEKVVSFAELNPACRKASGLEWMPMRWPRKDDLPTPLRRSRKRSRWSREIRSSRGIIWWC